MMDLILQILPQFDYCGILLPQKGAYQHQTLAFRAYSRGFPDELKNAKVNSGELVAGWVHKKRIPIFIEGLESGDGRISELEKSFTAVAVAPISTLESWGVVYAVRHREIEKDKSILSQLTRELFSILAGIVSEVSYNERLLVENARNAVKAIGRSPIIIRDNNDLVSELTNKFVWFQSADQTSYKQFNLSAIVLSINNLEEITELFGSSVSDWLEQQVPEISTKLFGRWIKGQLGIFRLQPGRFVLLLQRTPHPEDEIKRIAMNLKEILSSITLTAPSKLLRVECLSWGIVYSYDSYLRRKLAKSESQAACMNAEPLAKTLIKRFQKAALALWHNEQGHDALTRRDYPAAFTHFADAHAIDPESPYYLKHMAESLKESGNFEQALRYCDEALALDPDYAGGHYMKAEILTALGRIDEASAEYEVAIAISSRAKHYWLFGSALASYKKYDKAIEQFKKAKKLDLQNEFEYEFLIARIKALQEKLVEAQHKLRTIPTNRDAGHEILVQFEMKLLTAYLKENQL